MTNFISRDPTAPPAAGSAHGTSEEATVVASGGDALPDDEVAGPLPRRRWLVSIVLLCVLPLFYIFTAVTSAVGWTDASASPAFVTFSLIPRLVAEGEVWRLITASGLHLGPLDLLASLLTLALIGTALEDRFGRKRYAALLALCAFGAGAAVILFAEPISRTATATGVGVGLLAASVLTREVTLRWPALVIVVAADVIALTVESNDISLYAPLGGLVTGMLVSGLLVRIPHEVRQGRMHYVGLAVVFVVLVGISGLGIALMP